jgi:hypothetical protein
MTYFWQYCSPGRCVVFDFEMTRSGEVPKEVFKDYSGILHTDGYAGVALHLNRGFRIYILQHLSLLQNSLKRYWLWSHCCFHLFWKP